MVINSFNVGGGSYVQTVPAGPDPCVVGNAAPEGFLGNGSLVVVWEIIVPAGGKQTVAMTYKPM